MFDLGLHLSLLETAYDLWCGMHYSEIARCMTSFFLPEDFEG